MLEDAFQTRQELGSLHAVEHAVIDREPEVHAATHADLVGVHERDLAHRADGKNRAA